MLADLLHLSRTLRRSPASAAAAVLTLALTLGTAASIFAIVHAVVLSPPPFQDPGALVTAGEVPFNAPAGPPRTVSYATFEAWRDRAASLALAEAFDATNLTLTGLGAAERVSVTDVTPGLLSLLGASPRLGPGFAARDLGRPVVIVSDAFWRSRLAADPGVIGRPVTLGGRPHTIVGVMPEAFRFELALSDMWRPIPAAAGRPEPGYRVRVVARLFPNVTGDALEAALEDVSGAASPPAHAVTTPVATAIAGGAARTLGLLAGAASLAMAIAFINFAGLLIVRSIDRRRELAVRSALGARRTELARQLLLEAQSLVALGTLGGVLLASWMTPVLARLALEQYGGLASRQVSLGWPVMAVVAAAAATLGGACAVAPTLMASRFSVLDVLRRGVTSPRHELVVRRLLAAGEIALAFVLLASMTLVGGSLLRLLAVDPGFDPRGVMVMQVSLPASYTPEDVASFYARLQDDLDARVGPRTAAIVNEIPLAGSLARTLVGTGPAEATLEAVVREAGPAYFDVMRIPVVAGRSIEARDDASAPPRAVISTAAAKGLFGEETPVGRQIRLAATGEPADIIGVVGDIAHRSLEEPFLPTVYLAAPQVPSRSRIVVARSDRPDADVVAMVRDIVRALDADLPVYGVRPLEDVVAASPGMPARRVLTVAYTGFAALALALGAIGLFGVVAHDVANRRAELALRIAVGAGPVRIAGAIVGQGAAMVGAGLVLGGLLSVWAANAIGAAGMGADRLDVAGVTFAVTVLTATGGAALLPAVRRAVRTDPLVVLRGE